MDKAIEMRDAWLEAEKKVTSGQSYSIGDRSLTRANLTEIRNSINYWEKRIRKIKRSKKGKGSARITYAIPMD